ncbi:MAG: Coenzyme F420 hydrogenase/dehydrogenase, beta subunit C-terminal domain [Oscillospiraceae bacterium]|nr:Coenzyme F420 hydrogenase/dehydrogenase, beta subunit C-terminal domain [Oscillospiraceae bacterium]
MSNTVCSLNQCAGCMACVEACAVHAITVKDSVSAMNAEIDESKCVNCQRCHKVCPQNHQPAFAAPKKWYEGYAKEEIRQNSSSGGFAAQLMYAFIEKGGIVCTCAAAGTSFRFRFLEQPEEVPSAVGSKYVKSNPTGIYARLKQYLKDGKEILFIGLPCQCAGVLNFVGSALSEKLYTVDLICHGSPSPKILRRFLNENKLEPAAHQTISFRKNNKFSLYVDGIKVKPNGVRDKYTIGFLNGLFYTENCYSCRYAKTERISDITIGDSWGTARVDEKKKGISLALCQTEKGIALLESCGLNLLDVDAEEAVKANQQLDHPMKQSDLRQKFFSALESGKSVGTAVTLCYPKICVKQDIKAVLSKFIAFS